MYINYIENIKGIRVLNFNVIRYDIFVVENSKSHKIIKIFT